MLFNRIATVNIGTLGAGSVFLEGFRIAFDITKTPNKTTNRSTIQVSNLNENTRNKIREIGKVVELVAGYTYDRSGVIYRGDVYDVSHDRTPPNVTTIIECGDGVDVLRKAVSVSYRDGIPAKDVLIDLVKKFATGVKTNLKNFNFKNITMQGGFSFSGQGKYALDKVAEVLGLEWSVQDGELKFVDKSIGDNTRSIILSSETGMIGSPIRLTKRETEKGRIRKGTFDGWRVTSLLQPLAVPGGVVTLNSKEIRNSQFKIENVNHKGDTHGRDFITVMEVKENAKPK